MHFNSKGMPTNDTKYTAILKLLRLFNQLYGVHVMPIVINSLGADTNTCMHIDFLDESNFKKSGTSWLKVLFVLQYIASIR